MLLDPFKYLSRITDVYEARGSLPRTTMKRETTIRFAKEEVEKLKAAKEREGLAELPHAAYVMKLCERAERLDGDA